MEGPTGAIEDPLSSPLLSGSRMCQRKEKLNEGFMVNCEDEFGASSLSGSEMEAQGQDSGLGLESLRARNPSKSKMKRLKLKEIHTKGYVIRRDSLFTESDLSHFNLPEVTVQISSLFRSLMGNAFFTLIVLIFIAISLPVSNSLLLGQSKCETFGWNAYPVWKYRAKPRFVPALKMDPLMQEEFLQLFKGGWSRHPHHHHFESSSSEEDSSSAEDDHYVELGVELDIPTLERIADMCPKDAFFYSLSPKHLEATLVLARMFVDQPTPAELLKLARALRFNRYVNPKVWYFALIAAAEERPDMTGFKLAHPIDAMPDIFIPGPLLFDVMDKYRSALKLRDDLARNGTVAAITSIIHRTKREAKEKQKVKADDKGKDANRKGKKIVTRNPRKNLKAKPGDTTSGKLRKVKIGQGRQIWEVRKNATSDMDEEVRASPSTPRKLKKRRNKSKGRRDEDVFRFFEGNFTEFDPENHMLSKARIDAFEDCIVVDGSIGMRNGIENKLWYFREDMMVNQHHFYWHQEYPLNATKHRNRRAELFFYMHRNLIARYNAERYSNGMPRVHKFDIRPGAEIKFPYDSQLADVNSGKFWTPRPTGIRLHDIIHQDDPDFQSNIFIDVYNQLHGRLMRSVEVGELLTGLVQTMNIRHTKGIEPLGNTVEASELSVNPAFYDAMGFHNLGHQIIGLATDPEFKHKLPIGVMADTATTMRDPEFYSYHTVVDNIFDVYKKSLPPYRPRGGQYPLRWDGVEILNVEVVSKNGGPPNEMRTFWATKRFPLAPGVDGSIHKGDLDVDVCAVHLQHEPFDFKITVTLDPCAKTKTNKGTVRIFLAPRYDEHGHRLSMIEQRRLMIHLDAFPVDLRVGRNVIFRRSYDSNSVTPWTKHLKDYERDSYKYPHSAHFCGCGWPTHLYIPKGSKEGSPFDLFVMITNFDYDYVEDSPKDLSIPEPCNSPYLYCGVKWRKYPDAKPMGYPFDRLPFSVPIKCPKGVGPIWPFLLCKFLQLFWYRPVATLEEYVSFAPNMHATVVEIRHFDHLVW